MKSNASLCSILNFPSSRGSIITEFLFWILLVIIILTLKSKWEFSPFLFIHFMQYLLTLFHCKGAQQIITGQGAIGDQNKCGAANKGS